jgi:hypothetical protein
MTPFVELRGEQTTAITRQKRIPWDGKQEGQGQKQRRQQQQKQIPLGDDKQKGDCNCKKGGCNCKKIRQALCVANAQGLSNGAS